MDLTLIGTLSFRSRNLCCVKFDFFFVPSVAVFRTVIRYRRYTEAAAAFEHVGLKNMF